MDYQYSVAQAEALVAYMVNHPELASDRQLGNDAKDQQWSKLAEELNALKGAVNSKRQWETIWKDLESNTIEKACRLRREAAETGNISRSCPELTKMERYIVSIKEQMYVQGSEVADSMPEQTSLQDRLLAGDESVLWLPPSTTILDMSVPRTPEIGEGEAAKGCDSSPEEVELLFESPIPSTSTSRKTSPIRRRRITSKRKMKQQINDAKREFQVLVQQNNSLLEKIADAVNEATKIAAVQAAATISSAEALQKIAGTLERIVNKIN